MRLRNQRGQVAVLFAFGSMALIALVGFVLMAGLLYWDQRQLQVLADGGALAGAQQIPTACSSSTPVSTADSFLANQLGASSHSVPGGWTCGSAVTFSYGTDYSATITYPWNSKPYEIYVKVSRSGIPLQFGAFLGTSQANIGARAVAQYNHGTLPTTFALFAQQGVTCQGSGVHSPSPKILVNGSVYSGALATYGGNCTIYATATTAFDGSQDYGDFLVYTDGQTWAAGTCPVVSASPGQSLCADGFEESGHSVVTCGNNAGTSPQTEYLQGAQASNPDPCSGVPPPVPNLQETSYQGTEPNSDSAINSTIGGACTTTSGVNPGGARSSRLQSGSNKYGWGPAPVISGTVAHFQKGCYGYLDIGSYLKNNSDGATSAVLDPGFYLFNGYDCNSDNQSGCTPTTGGGLCLNASGSQSVILTGTDVLLEFVNSTSFSTASCKAGPTSACGGSACDFGTSLFAPNAPALTVSTPGTALPAGTYGFEITYTDAQGETTASTATTATLALGGQAVIATSGADAEATGVNFYLVSCSGTNFPNDCGAGGVNPGYLGSAALSGGAGSLAFSSKTQGNYVQPPPTNTAAIWLAAPPSSPESAPNQPAVNALTCSSGTTCSNLPAGQYTIAATYRTASCSSSAGVTCSGQGETLPSTTATITISAGQEIQVTTLSAPQGVTEVGFYLVSYSGSGTVNTGYLGQVVAPVGTSQTFILSSTTQGNSASAPTGNTTYSSWCSASYSGWTSTDSAICADRIIWAPSSAWSGGQIGGTFYVKGTNENSAIEGNIYWPGPSGSLPSANAAGCNYDANGVGGLLGQVICDSVFVQGGSSAGSATIGYSTGARYSGTPELALVE